MADLDQAEQEFTKAVADALAEVADEFAGAVGSATELTAAAFRVSSVASMWRERVRPLVRRLLGISETAARAAADDAGADLPDGWDDLPRRWDDGELPAGMGQYAQTTERLLNAVGDRLAEAARHELAAGLDAGESIDQLRDRLRTAFSREGAQLGPGREERIAVTEAGRAWNTATLAAARDASTPDRPLMKTWAARNDARTRTAHRRADGQTRQLDELFNVGGVQMRAPGDPDAPSTLTVGCRCRLRITSAPRAAALDSQPPSPPGFSKARETSTMGVDTTVDTGPKSGSDTAPKPDQDTSPPQDHASSEGGAEEQTTAALATRRRSLMASALSQAIASSGEWTPPAEWFEAPDGPVGELVSLDGRVQGYVARWADIDGTQMCHAGYAADGDCEPVPRGGDYSYFHQGNVELTLDDGSRVHPGLLTMDIGHGPGDPTVEGQIAHYDNPRAIAAAVVVGEDDTGIWMSGAVLPEVMRDPDRFTRLRLTPVSGHWSVTRPGGPMELIAVTAVNHPGFPQRTESGSYELAASLGADAPLALRLEASVLALTERIDQLMERTASAAREAPDGEEPATEAEEEESAGASGDEDDDAPEMPDGVDRELVTAALRLIKDGDVSAMTAAAVAPHGVELPQCLAVLADWLEGTGVSSQQSRAASVKAAEAICRSPEKQHAAVRARACRLISEYRAKGGK